MAGLLIESYYLEQVASRLVYVSETVFPAVASAASQRHIMTFEPYLRSAGDGTFELLVPSTSGAVHVLPYCFHTEEEAASWIASRKGRERIRKVRNRYERAKRVTNRYPVPAIAAIS